MLAEPIVNGLEEEMEGRLTVLRIEMQTPAGRDLSNLYGVRVTPTFVLLDAAGQETWRQIGSLNADQVRELVAGEVQVP